MRQFNVRIPGKVEEKVMLIVDKRFEFRKGYLAKAVVKVYGGIGGGK